MGYDQGMAPPLQFSLRRMLLAVAWAPAWGMVYAVHRTILITVSMADPAPSMPLLGCAMLPLLGILPFTAVGTLLGDTLGGTVLGGIVFSIAGVLWMSLR